MAAGYAETQIDFTHCRLQRSHVERVVQNQKSNVGTAVFSDTYRLSEMLFAADAAETFSAEEAEAIQKYAADRLARDPHALYPARPEKTLESLKAAVAGIRSAKK